MCKERNCPICGKALPEGAYRSAVYCSTDCKREGKRRTDRARRQVYVDNGICVHCGQAPAKHGSTYCEMCILNFRDYVAIRRERWKEKDLCHLCGKPKGKNNSVCDECAEKQKTRQKRTYADRISNGLCGVCGKRKVTEGYKSCSVCRDKYNHYAKKVA